jgi:signal transduction histidine kinase/CheY-like chemotaxis protein
VKTRIKLGAVIAVAGLLAGLQGVVDWHYASAAPAAKPVMLGLLALTVLTLLVAGGFLTQKIWAPLQRLARSAREVAAGNHRDRLPLPAPGELNDIAGGFNHLLTGLQTLAAARDELEKLEHSLRERTVELERLLTTLTAELGESERVHRALLAHLPGLAYRRRPDSDWTLEFMSAGGRELLGAEPGEFTAGRLSFRDRIHPEDRERAGDDVPPASAEPAVRTLEYRLQDTAGRWHSVYEQRWAIRDGQGRVIAWEGHLTDRTWQVEAERQRRRMEDQLRRAQKMEAIGILAGGVAHNFNNVLAGILGSAELIKMDLEPEHPAREFLDQIFLSGRRAKEVVQQVLTFSQWRENEHIVIQLQPVVRECVKLLRATLPAMVDITCQIDPDCPPVLADPAQIHQALMNLSQHAWKALPEDAGQLRVSLARAEPGALRAAGSPGPGVRLAIGEGGPEVDRTAPERVFEPFASVPPDPADGGLSLSVVHGIVKSHQGVFTVKGEPGRGLDFCIYLPAEALETEAQAEAPICLSQHHERILLVDDDEIAGRTMETLLNRYGYRVRRFAHPEAALAEFRAKPEGCDLVVSDLAMPDMTGMHLAGALRHLRPEIPILIITGMIDPAILQQARDAGLGAVLAKPASPAVLTQAIARLLGGREEPAPAPPGT